LEALLQYIDGVSRRSPNNRVQAAASWPEVRQGRRPWTGGMLRGTRVHDHGRGSSCFVPPKHGRQRSPRMASLPAGGEAGDGGRAARMHRRRRRG
jgi:hypothetical protein